MREIWASPAFTELAKEHQALLLPSGCERLPRGVGGGWKGNCHKLQRESEAASVDIPSLHPCAFPKLDSQGHVQLPSTCPNLFSVGLISGVSLCCRIPRGGFILRSGEPRAPPSGAQLRKP